MFQYRMQTACLIAILLLVSGCGIFHAVTPGEHLAKLLRKYPQLATTRDTVIHYEKILQPIAGGVSVKSNGVSDTLSSGKMRFIIMHDKDTLRLKFYLPGDTIKDTLRVPIQIVKPPIIVKESPVKYYLIGAGIVALLIFISTIIKKIFV